MNAEIIMVILSAVTLLIIMGGVWIKINVKINELDIRLLEMEEKLKTYKSERQDIMDGYKEDQKVLLEKIEHNNEMISNKMDKIYDIINSKFDDLVVVSTEVKNLKENCEYQRKNNK